MLTMIFIVIPVHNRKEFTRNCLSSLRGQTYKNFETIVIDDGSTDGTAEMLAIDFPEVRAIKGNGNLWWTGATNAGVDYVLENRKTGNLDYVLTLNNDLEVPENYLETLVKTASVYKDSILGSVSVDILNPKLLSFCGVSWNEFTGRYHSKAKDYNYTYKDLVDRQQIIDSNILPGRGTLIPINVFKAIGVYDSINFPQYAADEDFSLRARRNGWRLLIPTSTYVMCYINETGVDSENVRFSFKYYKYLFFSIKSPLNLKIRYRWAMKNTRLKLIYFIVECARIFFSVSFKTMKAIFK
jgi:GT2 family glycosyltransferase